MNFTKIYLTLFPLIFHSHYILSIWFWTMLFNTITGSVLYFARYIIQKKYIGKRISLVHNILKIEIAGWLFPLLLIYWFVIEPPVLHQYELFKATNILFFIIAGLFTIWLIGVLFYILRFAVQLIRIQRKVKKTIPCIKKEASYYHTLCINMNIKKIPALYHLDNIVSPMTTGIIRQVVYLPNARLNEEMLKIALTHELIHIKHKDYVQRNWLMLLSSLYWWNPIAKQLFWDVNEWNEYYCDQDCCEVLHIDIEYYFQIIRSCIQEVRSQRAQTNLEANLFRNKNTIKNREEMLYMEKNATIGNLKKNILLGSITAMTILSSGTISFASVLGYDKIMDVTTAEMQEEINEPLNQVSLEEIIELPEEEPEGITIIYEDSDNTVTTRSTYKSWTLKPNYMQEWNHAYYKTGDTITLSIMAEQSVDYGIVNLSSATKRYVIGSNNSHTFTINEDGAYSVFVRNRNSETVSGGILIQ